MQADSVKAPRCTAQRCVLKLPFTSRQGRRSSNLVWHCLKMVVQVQVQVQHTYVASHVRVKQCAHLTHDSCFSPFGMGWSPAGIFSFPALLQSAMKTARTSVPNLFSPHLTRTFMHLLYLFSRPYLIVPVLHLPLPTFPLPTLPRGMFFLSAVQKQRSWAARTPATFSRFLSTHRGPAYATKSEVCTTVFEGVLAFRRSSACWPA